MDEIVNPLDKSYYITRDGAKFLVNDRGVRAQSKWEDFKHLVLAMLNTEYTYTGAVGRRPEEFKAEYFGGTPLEDLVNALVELEEEGLITYKRRDDSREFHQQYEDETDDSNRHADGVCRAATGVGSAPANTAGSHQTQQGELLEGPSRRGSLRLRASLYGSLVLLQAQPGDDTRPPSRQK